MLGILTVLTLAVFIVSTIILVKIEFAIIGVIGWLITNGLAIFLLYVLFKGLL